MEIRNEIYAALPVDSKIVCGLSRQSSMAMLPNEY